MNVSINRIIVEDKDNRANGSAEIIESVRTEGILVPLLVFERGEDYVLIAGHRRLLSAQKFGLTEVPVQVLTEEQTETARALENLDRKQLHPLDEAEQIKKLQSKGYSNETIGAILGISKARVSRRAKLNNLSEKRIKDLREGNISLAMAEEYAVAPKNIQDKVETYIHYSAERLRNELLKAQGIDLSRCTSAFLKISPACAGCPKNPVSEEPGLFPELNGSCKDPDCYAGKLKTLMEKVGAKSVLSGGDYEKVLDGKVPFATVKWYETVSEKAPGANVYLRDNGEVRFKPTKRNDPERAQRNKIDEIRDRYSALKDKYEKQGAEYVLECATAYVSKNYRNMPLTDSSDIVKISRYLLEESKGTLLRTFNMNADAVASADNQRVVGLAACLAYAADLNKDHYSRVSPGFLYAMHDLQRTVTHPGWFDLEDCLVLKKTKARKAMIATAKEMQQVLDEYVAEEKLDKENENG